MSLNAAGSQYLQALQVLKKIKLKEYKVDAKNFNIPNRLQSPIKQMKSNQNQNSQKCTRLTLLHNVLFL